MLKFLLLLLARVADVELEENALRRAAEEVRESDRRGA